MLKYAFITYGYTPCTSIISIISPLFLFQVSCVGVIRKPVCKLSRYDLNSIVGFVCVPPAAYLAGPVVILQFLCLAVCPVHLHLGHCKVDRVYSKR